ncbi:P-loop NTPase fold protein [Niabella aurantiaca]|uniref:P-loop NTPase fold protein n=1 Tax=Niabella aurantiaca TaxID=379900 RepID=UPI00037BC563|nr:P-loop NTPase fold protein [Niabella aurantiaca]
MTQIDNAAQAFELYKSLYHRYLQTDLSESDTRSKLIDAILIDVLGWEEGDIQREGHVESGYYDYRISVPGIHFIVEAKRQLKELTLPSHHKRATINTLLKGNSEVINQIRNYAIDEGIQYGIITNGYQFVVLKIFNNDGKPWKDNSCLIFQDVDTIESRFIEFFENLSKYSVVNNGGFKFDLPINNVEYKTILSTLIDRDKELIRNSLSGSITPLIDTVFGEIFSEEREDDKEFIKKCFVENEETKKNKDEIERLFGDYAPQLSQIIPAVNSSSIASQISEELNAEEINIKNSYPPKPIIIIGSKGAGKTSFINHLFKYKLEDKELENHFIVYIDFRKFFEGATNFEPEKIASEILESIYNKYETFEFHSLKVLKRIYFKEIKRNDDSIWLYDKTNNEEAYNTKLSSFLENEKKNSFSHLEALSKYIIRERRKRLVVIIDNADQFNDTIQEKLFIFSHSLTKATLCGSVISLREGYYYKWQNSPPFDAYESNVYHITAPNYMEILQKRIDFALEKAHLFETKIRGTNQKGIKYEFPSGYIVDFLSGLKHSLFSSANSELISFLNHTTYPNIREGLKVFKSFLTSGHTKVQEYILREQYKNEHNKLHSIIPTHEFIKSIALQNRHYYNSQISIIINVFVPPIDSTDHFIKLYVLKDLDEHIEQRSYTSKFMSSKTLSEKLNSLGYKINSIKSAISELLKQSLIDTDEQISDVEWKDLPNEFNLSLTAKGHYYLKELVNRFHYYDLILQDCPIFNSVEFDKLKTAFPLSNENGIRYLPDRKQCVTEFISYLQNMEQRQSNQVKTVYGNLMDTIGCMVHGEIEKMNGNTNKYYHNNTSAR